MSEKDFFRILVLGSQNLSGQNTSLLAAQLRVFELSEFMFLSFVRNRVLEFCHSLNFSVLLEFEYTSEAEVHPSECGPKIMSFSVKIVKRGFFNPS